MNLHLQNDAHDKINDVRSKHNDSATIHIVWIRYVRIVRMKYYKCICSNDVHECTYLCSNDGWDKMRNKYISKFMINPESG